MREVIRAIETWCNLGRKVAIATNVRKEGSSLRPLGAKMAVTTYKQIAGSVSGGCIDTAVYEEAQGVIASGKPNLLHYSAVDAENAFDLGLSCGGTLDILVESLDSPEWRAVYPALKLCLENNEPVAVVTVISKIGQGNKMLVWTDDRRMGSLGSSNLDHRAAKWAQEQIQNQQASWTKLADVDLFVDVMPLPARLLVIGAVHIAIPLVSIAKTLGFQTIVIDPRQAYATPERFPHADELLHEWPAEALMKLHLDEGTYIVALSHDDKMDNPALAVALASSARYVGVLGAKKNISIRYNALREINVTDEQLKRLRAPVGMYLGANTPEEIALSIIAEIVAEKHGILSVGEN